MPPLPQLNMQNISLGDYKGGRDTLQTALGMKYDPLDSIMAATTAYAKEGLSNIGARDLYEQHDAATLGSALQQLDYKNEIEQQNLQGVRSQNLADTSEVLGGAEESMLQHAEHVFSLMSPDDQAKNLPWLDALRKSRGRGSVLERKGRLGWNEEHGTDNPFALARLTAAGAQKLPTDPKAPAAKTQKPSSSKHGITVNVQ